MLEFFTAGESHGKGIAAALEGLPAGIDVDAAFIDSELARRQGGYGRSARQDVERDRVEILAGVMHGKTTGAPLLLWIPNRDNRIDGMEPLTGLRPGHADIPGAFKYMKRDARAISERASARETAGRVAAGAVCKILLKEFGVDFLAHTIAVGGVEAERVRGGWDELKSARDGSPFYSLDAKADAAWKKAVDEAAGTGDTLGGRMELVVRGVVPGLGGCEQWDRRLDGRLAQAVMSIPSVKSVEIGDGLEISGKTGRESVDVPVERDGGCRCNRATNYSGGIEGGMTTGCDIVVRAAVKPVPTTGVSGVERHDSCIVPSAGVISESMASLLLCGEYVYVFGGPCLEDMKRNYSAWLSCREEFFRK